MGLSLALIGGGTFDTQLSMHLLLSSLVPFSPASCTLESPFSSVVWHCRGVAAVSNRLLRVLETQFLVILNDFGD